MDETPLHRTSTIFNDFIRGELVMSEFPHIVAMLKKDQVMSKYKFLAALCELYEGNRDAINELDIDGYLTDAISDAQYAIDNEPDAMEEAYINQVSRPFTKADLGLK